MYVVHNTETWYTRRTKIKILKGIKILEIPPHLSVLYTVFAIDIFMIFISVFDGDIIQTMLASRFSNKHTSSGHCTFTVYTFYNTLRKFYLI